MTWLQAFAEWLGIFFAVSYGVSVFATHGPTNWWTPIVIAATVGLWILNARCERRRADRLYDLLMGRQRPSPGSS
jgi:hypothetical protein